MTGEDAVLVLMPTRGTISYATHWALANNLRGVKHAVCIMPYKPVVEARNDLAREALAQRKNNPFPFTPREWFALWVDDDAYWTADTVPTMLNAMRDLPKLDALFGKFSARQPLSPPTAYRDADDRQSFPKENIDCTPGEIVTIERAGFHFVLMRLGLLDKVGSDPFTTIDGAGEDISFCDRAIASGATLAVGMGMPILHVDVKTNLAYAPGLPPLLIDGPNLHRVDCDTPDVREYGLGEIQLEAAQAYARDLAAVRARAQQAAEVAS